MRVKAATHDAERQEIRLEGNEMTKTEWRRYLDYLVNIVVYLDRDSAEYRNICRRIKWIWDNRL